MLNIISYEILLISNVKNIWSILTTPNSPNKQDNRQCHIQDGEFAHPQA